jgi:pyruvate/2-oxoglutarate dehydrogenase complex dihydrolipoamide acyltransferase (E2) component
MIEVRLPPIGEGIAEGEIVKWIVQKGQKIEAEQPLLEVLTDKAAVEIPAPQGGIVAELLFQEGDLVPVGSVVARLSQGEEVKTHSVAETLSVSSPAVSESSATVSQPQASDVAMATPAVRQKAREKGLELSQVKGTGPFGRILMEDLERHVPGLPASRSDAVIQPISVSAQSVVPPVRSALPAAQLPNKWSDPNTRPRIFSMQMKRTLMNWSPGAKNCPSGSNPKGSSSPICLF